MSAITKSGAIVMSDQYFAFRGFEFDDAAVDTGYHNLEVYTWALNIIEQKIAEQVQACALYEQARAIKK